MAATLVVLMAGWKIGWGGRQQPGSAAAKVPDQEILFTTGLAQANVAPSFAAPSPAGLSRTDGAPGIPSNSRRQRDAMIAPIGDVPPWAIAYGQEFWRSANPVTSLPRTGQGAVIGTIPACLNVGEVIDRVTHAFASPDASSRTRVDGRTYRATLDGSGLLFIAHRQARAGEEAKGSDIDHADPEARFRTVEVRQHQTALYQAAFGAKRWSVVGNTAQALLDPGSGLVEHYEAREKGIAVTWVLPQPLRGTEPLTIEAELTGLDFAGQTDSGVHFADTSGLARLRLGQVTAVDAQGRRWEIPLRVSGHLLRVDIGSELLREASYPLAIDPLLEAEFGMDNPIAAATPSTQAAPSVAANGTNYLVVWTHGKGETTDLGVCGARISPSGMLLDPYGISLGATTGEQTVCRVAANGGDFLVVWSAPPGNSTTDWDLFGVRVGADGTVMDSPPLIICRASLPQTSPALAANGDNYLVVWRDGRRTAGTIYGTLVTREGMVSATNGFPICTAANERYSPAVAALGTNYLVVWQDYRRASSSQFYADIFGARVTGSGVLLDANGIAICTNAQSQWYPAVAANGTNYLVVWEDYNSAGNDIFGARVSAAGLVLETNGFPICTAFNAQAFPVVASNGNDFLVAWQDHRNSTTNAFVADIYATRIAGDGRVIETNGIAVTTAADSQWYPAVAANDTNYLIVWQDFRNNPDTTRSDIYGARLSSSASALDVPDLVISASANVQWSPAVAGNGTNYLIVWADNRNNLATGFDIYGARVNRTGGLLDHSPLALCTATNNQLSPALAAGGANFLVVWADWRNSPTNGLQADIYGTRVSGAGQVLDPNGLAVCMAPYDQDLPAIAANGTNYFVVWQDARSSLSSAVRWDIFGARVASEGTVLDTNGFPISTVLNNQITPAVAGNGTDYLVVWSDYRPGTTADIYGARVTGGGIVVDTVGIPISTAVNNQTLPAVAANGPDYLVVWADARNNLATGLDIYGARVDHEGKVLEASGIAISSAANQQTAPAIVANGADYFVAWLETRTTLTNAYDLCGVSINTVGNVLGNTAFTITTNANSQLSLAIAGDTQGQFLLMNQGFRFLSSRGLGRWINLSLSNNAPARLHSAERMPNGQFRFSLGGEPGPRYALEASDNLVDWIPLGQPTASNGVLSYIDSATTHSNHRFYRAITLP